MTDKVVDIDFKKLDDTSNYYVFQCGGVNSEYCGSESFFILETHYECTDCGKHHTFDDVHGSIN